MRTNEHRVGTQGGTSRSLTEIEASDPVATVRERLDDFDSVRGTKFEAVARDVLASHASDDLRRLLGRLDEIEAENKILKDREDHFAKVLGVADMGLYRYDWDAKLERALEAQLILDFLLDEHASDVEGGEIVGFSIDWEEMSPWEGKLRDELLRQAREWKAAREESPQ